MSKPELSALPSSGWIFVPVVPTNRMIGAGGAAAKPVEPNPLSIYSAMIAASPVCVDPRRAADLDDPWIPLALTLEQALRRGDDPVLVIGEGSPLRDELRRLLSEAADGPDWIEQVRDVLKDCELWHRGSSWRSSADPEHRKGWQKHLDALEAALKILPEARDEQT